MPNKTFLFGICFLIKKKFKSEIHQMKFEIVLHVKFFFRFHKLFKYEIRCKKNLNEKILEP